MTTILAPTPSDPVADAYSRLVGYYTGTPAAGRHAAAPKPDTNLPTVPADTLAFTIGDNNDPNRIYGIWVRENHTSHLDLETADGGHLEIPVELIPTLAIALRNAPSMAVFR